MKSILPVWMAVIVQVPPAKKVTTAAETVQTTVVTEAKVIGNPDDAEVPVMVNGDALNGCPAMPPKVMVWDRLATTRRKLCDPFDALPFDAVMVKG